MNNLDLSVEELHRFSGRNPRPADHDAYWAEALAELAAQPDDLELIPVPSPDPVEWFELWFTGVGGSRVFAKYARPRGATGPQPAVIQFHGYSMYSCNWPETVQWTGLGFSFFALDTRGQGGRSEDRGGASGNTLFGHVTRGLLSGPKSLYYRNAYLDCAQLARIAAGMPEVDGQRMGATGQSQGGALALVCAALYPEIKRCAPKHPFLCDFKRCYEMDLLKDAFNDAREYIRRHDPTHTRIDQFWNDLGYIDVQHLAPRIRAEVLLGCGLSDPICPPSSQFAAYNKITSPKEVLLYPDFAHEHMPHYMNAAYRFLAAL